MNEAVFLVEANPEDESLALCALKDNNLGDEVVVAHDGAEALGYLLDADLDHRVLPQLVLLSIDLPKVDGLQVLRRLRDDERTKDLPVVMLTAEDPPASLNDHGANVFMRKPVTSGKLVESARRLGLSRLVTEGGSPTLGGPRSSKLTHVPPHRALRVLLVEDSEDDAFFLLRELRRGSDYEVVSERVDTPETFAEALDGGDWDIVICDYIVPGFGALEALELMREKGSELPFIVVSGFISEDKSVEVMRVGAHDFINKSNLSRLGPAIEREVREAEVRWKHSSVEEELRRSEERFRATFEQAAMGIAHVALDGRWLRVNGKLCEVLGYSREEMLNLTFQQITHPNDLDKNLEQVRRILDRETASYSMEKRYVRKDGSTIWANLTVSLVRGYSGEPEYFITVIEDIAERKRAEEAQRFLDNASAKLSSSLDYQATLTSMAHLAVPYLADWCAVDMVEEDGTIVRLVVVHEDPEKVALAQELQERYPPDLNAEYGVMRVLRTGQSELVPEIPESLLDEATVDAEHRSILHGMGLKSYLIVPLIARGRKLGALSLVSVESGRSYGDAELELAEEFARRAALCIENAWLYKEAQREIAERKKAEEALTRLASFPRLNPNPVVETKVAGEPSYLNPAAKEVFPDLSTLGNEHPILTDLESIDHEIRRSGGQPVTREVQVGDAFYHQSVSAVPGSELLRLYSIDTTELRQAEEALKKSEARFRSLVQNASDLIVVLDADGTIRYESPAVERMVGFRPEERIETNAFGHLHPDDVGSVREKFTELLEKPTGRLSAEYRIRDREGYWRYFEAIGANLLHDPSIQGVVINARDITERKIAEKHREAQYAVSRILAEPVSLEEAAPRFLEAIGVGLGWELGALWLPDQSAGVLRCEEIWRAPSVVAAEFEATSREMSFTPGHGLPGRVWESGQPLWVPDYLADTKYPRYESAAKEGLHGACAFPIQNDGRILGVVDFFSYEILPLDKDMIQTVAILGNQIGQFIERRLGEQALQESEERYRVVAQTASDAIFVIDEDSRILFVNDAAKKIFGYTSEEMLGERLTMLMPEHLRHAHQAALKRYVDTGRRHLTCEALHLPGLHKSGREIPLEVSFGEFAKAGRSFFTGFVRDITERKKAEEALRETEEKYRGIFENAVDGIFQISPDGRLLTANPALARMFGYDSPEEMVAEVTDVGGQLYVDPGDREQLMHLVREHGGVSAFESRVRRKDGEEIWIAVNAYAESDASRELVCLEGTVEDITERKRAEEARSQSEELYRTVVEQAAENIYLIDVETKRVLASNAALQRSLGYTAEELGQMTLYDIVAHGRESIDRNIQRIMERERTFFGERLYRRKDGSLMNVEVSASPICYEGKEAMCITAHDITDRQRAENMLRRSLDSLLALYEAGHVLGSTLESEEVGSRLLRIMQRVSSLTTAVISRVDEHGRLSVWRAVGVENLQERLRYAPEIQEALYEVLKTGEHRIFRSERLREDGESVVGLCLPLRIQNRAIGLLETYGPETLLEDDTVEILSGLTSQAASALENARLYGELAEREKRLQELVGKILDAQEEERRRVAYEVHDGLAQVAVAAHQRLQAFARRHPPASEKGRDDLDRILTLVQQTVGDSRRIIADLRPTALDDFGLAVALRQEVEALHADGWQVKYEENLGDERLPAPVEVALFRVAQEALTNARKHAQTQQACLTLRRQEDVADLEVRDWGRGFDPNALQDGNGPGERIGLSGMRERVSVLSGEFEIRSRPGEGTSITARIPLPTLTDNGQEDEHYER